MPSRVTPPMVDAETSLEQILAVLRSEGHRVTTPRRLLVRCLLEAAGHKTADELAEAVQRLAPDVHLSTIYRNLDELERLGVIEHSHLGHGAATYHLTATRHGHLVCEVCGSVIEVPPELFAATCAESYARYGFVIDADHVALVGRCASCAG